MDIMQNYGADERRYAEAAAWPELTLARVISQHKDLYNIITESGELDERRLQNYLKLKKESRYEGQSSREIESAKIGDMFGSKSAMKKTRDFYKNKK